MITVPMGYADFPNTVVRGESEKALKVELDSGEHIWVPKSLIADESEVNSDEEGEGNEGTLIIPEWWAEDKGLM